MAGSQVRCSLLRTGAAPCGPVLLSGPTGSSNHSGALPDMPKVLAHRFSHTFDTWAIEHDARELDVQ
jgi:hypothetical protein